MATLYRQSCSVEIIIKKNEVTNGLVLIRRSTIVFIQQNTAVSIFSNHDKYPVLVLKEEKESDKNLELLYRYCFFLLL